MKKFYYAIGLLSRSRYNIKGQLEISKKRLKNKIDEGDHSFHRIIIRDAEMSVKELDLAIRVLESAGDL